MWQFAEVVRGIGDACRELDTPVTGGNVSFYNETDGKPIQPTPVIGMLGVIDVASKAIGIGFTNDGDDILLLGATGPDDFGGSEFALVIHGTVGGRPPQLDMAAERSLIEVLVTAAESGLLRCAHDLSAGGLGVALAESALAGGRGFSIRLPEGEPHRLLFAESPSRAIVGVAPAATDEVAKLCEDAGVPVARLGTTGGARLDFGIFDLDLTEAKETYEGALPVLLGRTI